MATEIDPIDLFARNIKYKKAALNFLFATCLDLEIYL